MHANRAPDGITETSTWRLYTWIELDRTLYLLTVTSACTQEDCAVIDRHVPRESEVIHGYESQYFRGSDYEFTTLRRLRRATPAITLAA